MTEILPDPYLYLHDPEEYLSSVRSKFPSIQIDPKVSLGLGIMEFKKPKRMRKELDKEPTRFGACWFGGQPFENGREWPRSSDGTLLTHIAQVDLGYESMNVGDPGFIPTGLPNEGIIQFFHDTQNMGEPEDVEDLLNPPWAIRYFVPENDEVETFAFMEPSGDAILSIPLMPLDIDGFMNLKDQFSVDFRSEEEAHLYADFVELTEFEIYNRLLRFEAQLPDHRPEHPDFIPDERISRMSGWSACEIREEYNGQLATLLPLTDASDEHVLLFEINPRTFPTPGWFHERPVQVWIRRTDLDARNFDHVWCLIRTDA